NHRRAATPEESMRSARWFVCSFLLLHLLLGVSLRAQDTSPDKGQHTTQAAGQDSTQNTDQVAALWSKAPDLYNHGNFVEALPLFEQLNNFRPNDPKILELYAFCTLTNARTISDPEARKAARIKARQLGLQAKAAGDTSELGKIFTDIPEDGSE